MEKLHVLRTNEEIDSLIKHLSDPDKPIVAWDTETDGLALTAKIVGISVACDDSEAFYIVCSEWRFDKKTSIVPCDTCSAKGVTGKKGKEEQCYVCKGSKQTEKHEFSNQHVYDYPTKDKILELLDLLSTKSLITQNGIVDYGWTSHNYGKDIRHAAFLDVMVAAHLLDENRPVGLKALGASEYGESATQEQEEMRESVIANGGIWERRWDRKKKRWSDKRRGNKEMFKADPELLGRYGAKDALLTLRLGYKFAAELADRNLDTFYYEESHPLFFGPTYELNQTGFRCDVAGFKKLQKELEDECAILRNEIETDIAPYTKELYPKGFGKGKNQFNLSSGAQLAWLLFIKLKNDWKKLTDSGRDLAKTLIGKAPYNPSGRRNLEHAIKIAVDARGKPLKLEKYLKCDKSVLSSLAHKYVWVERFLQLRRAEKLLNAYVIGLQPKIKYGIIHPTFSQCRTTGNRYASSDPNWQVLPRDDKRLKSLILSRPGKIFVGSDFAALEPRVFASLSGDERLRECFASGRDIYCVIGIDIFDKHDATPYKSGPDSFGEKYPLLRQVSKELMLSATYGITPYRLCEVLNTKAPRIGFPWNIDEVQEIINKYFEMFPNVKAMQERLHKEAIDNGVVYSIFGRPRHVPSAKLIRRLGKNIKASELPYEYRSVLNNSCNAPIQSTAGSVNNRSLIAVYNKKALLEKSDPIWKEVKIVGTVHDDLWLEGPESLSAEMISILQEAMENSVELPGGVKLKAEPKSAYNLADLK